MSQYLSWHVGMKVVCVDDSPAMEAGEVRDRLVCGRIYTIREIGPEPRCVENPRLAGGWCEVNVWLNEVTRVGDLGYAASRFRPVQERKTSIEVFTKLLHRVPAKEDA